MADLGVNVSDNIRCDVINSYLLTWRIWGLLKNSYILLSCVSVVRCSLTYSVTEGRWEADDHLAISYSCVSVVRCSLTYPVTEGHWGPTIISL